MIDVHLVVDPWTRETRGFGFVTMESVEEADRCIKHLNRSVLEGRVITVEKVNVLSFLFIFSCLLIIDTEYHIKIMDSLMLVR